MKPFMKIGPQIQNNNKNTSHEFTFNNDYYKPKMNNNINNQQ